MNQHGIRFSILDFGIMKSDINLVACGSVTATRSKPEDIRTVVLSHMHVDHTGYLYLFRMRRSLFRKKNLPPLLPMRLSSWIRMDIPFI